MLFIVLLLAASAHAHTGVFTVKDLGSYPGYDGQVKLEGEVTLSFVDTHVSMSYTLEGAEKACEKSSEQRPANACGIHIHQGTNCDDVNSIGGHYFKGSSDAWANVVYETEFEDKAIGYVSHVEFGYTVEETVGYLLVLHDSTGARVTCTSIQDQAITVPDVGVYPGKTSTVDITGSVKLVFGVDSARIIYNLAGVEEACKTPGTASNACGIHIHEGTDCKDATQPGGHYYNTHKYKSDPWASIVYVPSDTGKAVGSVNVGYGESWTTSIGRVLVVHDSTGARVTCEKIGGKLELFNFEKYPGYDGDLNVKGYAQLYFLGTSVRILHNLSSVDRECKTPSDASNSCGIHIHEAACEADGGAGGHYFNKDKYTSDPWAPVVYQEYFAGLSKGSETIEYGYDYDHTLSINRSLVVHDKTGARVSCVTMKDDSKIRSMTNDRIQQRRV